VFGTHIAIYLTNAGNTRTPLHENSPNQVTNSETSPGPPPATAVFLFCPFPGRSLIFCHVYCPPDENWTEFFTFQIRTESAGAAESGGAGQEEKQPGLSTDTGSVSVRRQR